MEKNAFDKVVGYESVKKELMRIADVHLKKPEEMLLADRNSWHSNKVHPSQTDALFFVV